MSRAELSDIAGKLLHFRVLVLHLDMQITLSHGMNTGCIGSWNADGDGTCRQTIKPETSYHVTIF